MKIILKKKVNDTPQNIAVEKSYITPVGERVFKEFKKDVKWKDLLKTDTPQGMGPIVRDINFKHPKNIKEFLLALADVAKENYNKIIAKCNKSNGRLKLDFMRNDNSKESLDYDCCNDNYWIAICYMLFNIIAEFYGKVIYTYSISSKKFAELLREYVKTYY